MSPSGHRLQGGIFTAPLQRRRGFAQPCAWAAPAPPPLVRAVRERQEHGEERFLLLEL